jgi:hypothetical protein
MIHPSPINEQAMSQITTCSFFRVEGFNAKFWAFKQMQLGASKIKHAKGLVFFKFLGSGSGNGFQLWPNFNVYALLCVWESEADAENFFSTNELYTDYVKKSSEIFTLYLKSADAHGKWSGQQPFQKQIELSSQMPVVVLTRARIKFSKLWFFWQKVGKVSASLQAYDDHLFSIGIGEWPMIQQATISIWKTRQQMMDYAYNNEQHLRVVKLTRQFQWYSEEMFARFQPYKTTGTWQGKSIVI